MIIIVFRRYSLLGNLPDKILWYEKRHSTLNLRMGKLNLSLTESLGKLKSEEAENSRKIFLSKNWKSKFISVDRRIECVYIR